MTYPTKHISIRVPWHDTGWDGRVCKHPHLNGSCLKLKRIARDRDDAAEEDVAGQMLGDLPESKWPCCVSERMAFMSPFEYVRTVRHPYTYTSRETHEHFAETPLRHPAYSAPAVPFGWMLSEQIATLAEQFGIDARPEREPDLGFKNDWVQDRDNQIELFQCFVSHLRPEVSLCFFYAKHVPFVEDSGGRRVLIGVGRVKNVAPPIEYRYSTDELDGKLRSMLWELMVQHSIRPDFEDGFLFPYHDALRIAEDNPDFDPATVAAFSPDDRLLEFSYGSELVTHDGAIGALLSCAESLRRVSGTIEGPWARCLNWVDARVGELWKARGPFPGLGSALSAFGLEQGTFIAWSLVESLGENEDPWPLVDAMFRNPAETLPSHLAAEIGSTMQEKWRRLPDERRHLLTLLSRFELQSDQVKTLYVQEERRANGNDWSDSAILHNPYLLYETTRLTVDPISIWTVDRGVFPDEVVRATHPLPEPTRLQGGTDARRVRALTTKVLEDHANSGSTLAPQDQVVMAIRNLEIAPACPVDSDLMQVAKDRFEGVILDVPMAEDRPALQLERFSTMAGVIRTAVSKRVSGKRLAVSADWSALLDSYLEDHGSVSSDELETQARVEKTAALAELAESRLTVLIGPAGTGKTTLLSVLCSQTEIARDEVLLLAPTGKARVRMERATSELKLKGYTVAQFLSPDRYDNKTGRYCLSEKPVDAGARTVIVDEASMLTEEMLAALIQALKGVHRLILVGDPRQLPPIGAGRPFVDIVKHLAPIGVEEIFPRVGPGYAELTVRRRQAGEEREDLMFAEWFGGAPLSPGEDAVFDRVVRSDENPHVKFTSWESPDELRAAVVDTLVRELGLADANDTAGFDACLGSNEWKGMRFFNFGAAEMAEDWQILSPVRAGPDGVAEINRLIHKRFRQDMIDASRKRRNRKYPKPMGPEEIVYGDKVINVINTDPSLYWFRHRKVYPKKDNPYIANGELGVVEGFFWRKDLPDFRWKIEVEFSSQPHFKYDFTGKDFSEESSPALELAYALTIHKSQGSEFGTVILVLPNPCRLLSRELIYTALTRQRKRVVILHQGSRGDLRKYSSDAWSVTAQRLTNLFEVPAPIDIDGRFYEDRLIHRTSRGEMVRSKSEVIIADRLANANVEYLYERPLTIGESTKFPDFTIEDIESGTTYYWEHCGMLHVPSYKRRWEQKLEWYKGNGIVPFEDGGGDNGTLIVTRDSDRGGISSQEIEETIREVLQ